ncbi:MAG: hypothetical protein QXD48_01260 [Candidatus Aenigmatarchaeota archaeon]
MYKVGHELIVPGARSFYPLLDITYKSEERKILFSEYLIKTRKSYYDAKKIIPKGYRMSTAAEELALQLYLERYGIDPRKAKIFDDLFGRDIESSYVWQWTETGLRVPHGFRADKYEKDAKGRKYWPRIVLLEDKEVGEILIPEGHGRVVVEWDEVFGLPKVTEDIEWPHKPFTTHFWFRPEDDDLAVRRGGFWHDDMSKWCLYVDAICKRVEEGSYGGFRLVHGPFPEIKKI